MSEEAKTSYKPRILSTEDDADTREVLRLPLEMERFDATCVEDSAQAVVS
jgi:DNA-binding response OmpR family regulator